MSHKSLIGSRVYAWEMQNPRVLHAKVILVMENHQFVHAFSRSRRTGAAALPAKQAQEDHASADTVNQRVGSLGSVESFVFEGNASFTEDQLSHALRKDIGFVLASHPAEPFQPLPDIIANALKRGYLDAGFPDIEIQVSPDSLIAGKRLRIEITEGPRYRMGEILVEGAKEVDPGILRRKLTVPSKGQYDNSLAGLVRKVMANHANLLPAIEQAAAGADPGQPGAQQLDFLKSPIASSDEADWTTGKPVSFSAALENPMLGTVRQRLAEMGYPLAELETSHDLLNDGRANLRVSIKREGPHAMIGHIKVIGNIINPERDIMEAAGLKSGAAFNPQSLDEAVIQLWNSGRFFPFDITSVPSGSNAASMDILVRVVELKGTPALVEASKPATDAARRFITTINEWLCTGNHEDFVWKTAATADVNLEVGVSSKDGIVFRRQPHGTEDHQWASLSNKEILFDFRQGTRESSGKLPGLAALSGAFFNILPDGENKGGMAFGIGVGLSSLKKPRNPLGMEILISPALPFLKPEKFRNEGDHVIYHEGDKDLLSIDIWTALPIAANGGEFIFRNGCVRKIQDGMTGVVENGDKSMGKILDSSIALMKWIPGNEALVDGIDESWIRAAALLLKHGSDERLTEWFGRWRNLLNRDQQFNIPIDTQNFPADGAIMQLLIGFGAISLTESIAPPGSWISELGRELVFVYGGKTKHTKRTLERLLTDRSMGPFGAILTSKTVANFDPEAAEKFSARATALATPEGFRKDWHLLLNRQLGLRDVMEDMLKAWSRLSPEEEREILSVLDPSQAEWLQKLFDSSPSRKPDSTLVEWLTPHMDALWTRLLADAFRRNFDSEPDSAKTPEDTVAKVNGKPIRPWMITALRDGFFESAILQPPPVDAAKVWTHDRFLALAVRAELICQEAERRGWMITGQKADEVATRLYPELKGANDETWASATGLNRADMIALCVKSSLFSKMLDAMRVDLKQPEDQSLREFYQIHGKDLSRVAHVHEIHASTGDGRSLSQAIRAARLVRQAADLVEEGLPFRALTSASTANERSGMQFQCVQRIRALDMPPALYADLASMSPGQNTGLGTSNQQATIVRLEEWSAESSRSLHEVNDQVAALLIFLEQRRTLDEWCKAAENSAEIEFLGMAPPAPDSSIFKEMLAADPYSAVGQLGNFWEMVIGNQEGAGKSLDDMIFEGFLEVPDLVILADALLGLERKSLATACLKEALDRNRQEASNMAKELVKTHEKTGCKGMQDQLEALLKAGSTR